MGINCKIKLTQTGDIDYVEAPNGNRSLLFDALRNILGDEKAKDYYALTETELFKDVVKANFDIFKNKILNSLKLKESESKIITPENSSNYANLTEDGQGNFVFYHRGGNDYKIIKKSSGSTLATSKTEVQALSKVGGLAMYYTKEDDAETIVSSTSQYLVKVPKEKVYDYNTDFLNLATEARKLNNQEHQNSAFDNNTQLAYVTKLAAKNGYDMVVAEWDGRTRAQTTREIKPVDVRVIEGNTIVKDFEQNYKSNTEKGFESVIPQSKSDKLQNLYTKINQERNSQGKYDYLYHLYTKNTDMNQEEITELINNSDISKELKVEYNEILISKEEKRFSKSNKLRTPTLQDKGVKIFSKDRVNPFNNRNTGEIELENIESEERGKGNAREVLNKFLQYTDALGKNVYLDVAPRDLKTSEKKLRTFYSSLGFVDNGDGLSMTRKAKKLQSPDIDTNGEPKVEVVFKYANATEKTLSKENIIEAKDTTLAFGLNNSSELLTKLQDAFVKNGMIVFDKSKMAKAGYTEYEISKILSTDEIREDIKKNLPLLKNTDFETGDYSIENIKAIPSEIGIFGKQKVQNPFEVEKEKKPQQQVKTVFNEEIIDKTNSIKQILPKTYQDVALSLKALSFINSIINSRQNVSERNQKALRAIVKELKEEVVENGIDLKDIENRTANISKLQDFAEALKTYITDSSTFDYFTDIYDEFFELNNSVTKGVREKLQENDIVLDTNLSEYELFKNFNLVRKNKDIYTKVKDKTVEELREVYQRIYSDISEQEIQANTPTLEIEDFEADVDVMEKMYMWKNYLGYPIKTISNFKIETIDIKDFKEVVNNPYKKITTNGIELISNDSITKSNAELFEKEEKTVKKNQIFDDNLEKRKQALEDKNAIDKIKTDYQYIEPDILATTNNKESFVRTVNGVFERVYEKGNVSFFSRVVSEDKNYSDINFNNYNYLQTDGNEIEAKQYYTKTEIETINNKYFNCK